MFGVALRQIIVDGDDEHPLAGEGVYKGGHDGHQGLALAGFHLGDTAVVEHQAAENLNREGSHAQHPPGGLANQREGVDFDVVRRRAVSQPLLQRLGHRQKFSVGELSV